MTLQAITWDNGRLEILDQTLLPETTRSVLISGVEDGWRAINNMQVTRSSETSYSVGGTRLLSGSGVS